jgi:hypothetical protein
VANWIEIIKIVAASVAVTMLTILADRWFNDRVAIGVLAVCIAVLCWVNRDWIQDQARDNKTIAIVTCVVIFAIFGALMGLMLTRPKSGQSSKADEVSKVESLLTSVRDPAYRQLVAAVIHAADPNATLAVGALVSTPDGIRTVDIEVRSANPPMFTAIDIVELPDGQVAGVSVVDAADSKRDDIKADAMIVCSNTGFDEISISKAKRKRIGLISILRQGDKRASAAIYEEVYLRKIFLGPAVMSFEGEVPSDFKVQQNSLNYQGKSVDLWLENRVIEAALLETFPDRGTLRFRLIQPTIFDAAGRNVLIHSLSITFDLKTQWFSQTVRLDAKAGIYDYLRGRVRLARGDNSYTLTGINFDTATPMKFAPGKNNLGFGLLPGEISLSLTMFSGGDDGVTDVSNFRSLNSLIRSEDLIVGQNLRR